LAACARAPHASRDAHAHGHERAEGTPAARDAPAVARSAALLLLGIGIVERLRVRGVVRRVRRTGTRWSRWVTWKDIAVMVTIDVIAGAFLFFVTVSIVSLSVRMKYVDERAREPAAVPELREGALKPDPAAAGSY
jgi:hypothetical protein